MLTFIGICLILFSIVYFFIDGQSPACKDDLKTVRPIKSKEFLMKIPKFSEKLNITYPTLATINFSFASRNWSAAIEYSASGENVVLKLNNKNQTLPSSNAEIFLSIAIVHSKGEHVFYWYNINMSDANTENSTEKSFLTGPSAAHCLKNKDLLFPDDVLTLFIRISNYSLPFCMTAENHHVYNKNNKEDTSEDKPNEGRVDNRTCIDCKVLKNLSKNLKDLYLDEKDPDVQIIVRNLTLKAHRAILKARSPVLTTMLSENVSVIEDDCDPKDFVTFLHFLYSGRVDNLNNENAISVYIIADEYEVPDLKDVCAKYIISMLNVNSVSNVISLALKYEDNNLLQIATDFFLKNAAKIFITDEWQAFLKENPAKANELVINSYSYLKNS